MTNRNHSTLYVGVTSYLYSRVIEHKEKAHPKSFTARYNLNKLVYFESFHSIEEAIAREKQLKGGSRQKKIDLNEQPRGRAVGVSNKVCFANVDVSDPEGRGIKPKLINGTNPSWKDLFEEVSKW